MSLKSNSASYLSRAKRLLFFIFATTHLVPVFIYLSKASTPAIPNYGSQTSTLLRKHTALSAACAAKGGGFGCCGCESDWRVKTKGKEWTQRGEKRSEEDTLAKAITKLKGRDLGGPEKKWAIRLKGENSVEQKVRVPSVVKYDEKECVLRMGGRSPGILWKSFL